MLNRNETCCRCSVRFRHLIEITVSAVNAIFMTVDLVPPCLQHLIHHGGEALRRSGPCPLCTAPIVARDLRMALVHGVGAAVAPPDGTLVDMLLLKRPRGSILPQPVLTTPAPSGETQRTMEYAMPGTE